MKIWIHLNGVQEGPFDINDLPVDRMTLQTPVWYQGLEYWKEAGKAELTAQIFVQNAQNKQKEREAKAMAEVHAKAESTANAPQPQEYEISEEEVVVEVELNDKQEPISESRTASKPIEPANSAEQQSSQTPVQPEVDDNDDTDPDLDAYYAQQQKNMHPRPQQYPHSGYRQSAFQQPVAEPSQHKKPNTYIILSVILTILCCNPVGIVPIILGINAMSKYRNMQYDTAARAAETTQWWVAVTIVTSLILLPFSFLIML